MSDGTGPVARISHSLPPHPQLSEDLPKVSVSLLLQSLRVFSAILSLSLADVSLLSFINYLSLQRFSKVTKTITAPIIYFVLYFLRITVSYVYY